MSKQRENADMGNTFFLPPVVLVKGTREKEFSSYIYEYIVYIRYQIITRAIRVSILTKRLWIVFRWTLQVGDGRMLEPLR